MSLNKTKETLMPEPSRLVHPRPVRQHGFFGWQFVRQHMLIDDRWTPASLSQQFVGMSDLLAKRQLVKRMAYRLQKKSIMLENKRLKLQIHDGYQKLNKVLFGEAQHKVRNELINHKDMQRLFKKSSIEIVAVNINQRTFVMRKERDRLKYRLEQIKEEYKNKLLNYGSLGTRIRYEGEFVLEEEKKSREYNKKIENSNIRLKAVKAINATYRKVVQILQHDSIFYEPILRSLSKDIVEQTTFIKHVLHLGTPALNKFKQLSEQFRAMEEKSRKNLEAKIMNMGQYRREMSTKYIPKVRTTITPKEIMNLKKRYVRETNSMQMLKMHLENIERTVKEVKVATLCSQAKEMFPRINGQMQNNKQLHKHIHLENQAFNAAYIKSKRGQLLAGVLQHNLSEEETERIEHIKALRKAIAHEEFKERKMVKYTKNRGEAFVLIRRSLWTLNELLHFVERPSRSVQIEYPQSYLKLPLLKFEMLNMRAYAPEQFEADMHALCHNIKHKLLHVMLAFKDKFKTAQVRKYVKDFMQRTAMANTELSDDDAKPQNGKSVALDTDLELELMEDQKIGQSVPNRKTVKADSARLLEEVARRSD